MKRPGYYVEGKFYRDNYHQARARAAHLANEYGRGVEVRQITLLGESFLVCTVFNGKREAA
jgi:hypothetical protein